MKTTLSVTFSLAALWLLLSGHYTAIFFVLGALSVALVTVCSLRMDVVDDEGQPFHLKFFSLLMYWGWLSRQIFWADLAVCRLILRPDLPISPVVAQVPTSQSTDLGRVVYANSVTLTPGTVAIDVGKDHMEVHLLTCSEEEGLRAGGMDQRVTVLENLSSS